MKLLGNRQFALFLTVAIAVFATLLGLRGSLSRHARDVEAMFYDGVYLKDEGYTQQSIDSNLAVIAQTALDCATLMGGNPGLKDESTALLLARNEFLAARSITEKHSSYIHMRQAFAQLSEKAGNLSLSDRESEAMAHYTSRFSGAQTAIGNSQYNQIAAAFIDDTSFLARFLRPYLFVAPPQLFL